MGQNKNLLLACSLAALAACGSDAGPPDAAPGQPTLAAIRAEIFNGTCALSSCHAPPTLAAKLNLHDDGLCELMVTHTSCLFSTKLLVIPGKPEGSFLIDKLRGRGLTEAPDPACATSNERMPMGQPALAEAKIAQIEQWILDGASCGNDVPGDGGTIDAGIDGGDDALADVASITALATTIQVGERTQVTVTLTHGAPTAGQSIIIEPEDVAILAAPPVLHADHGVASVTFDVQGKAVAATTTLTASSGINSMALTMTVTSAALQPEVRSGGHPVR